MTWNTEKKRVVKPRKSAAAVAQDAASDIQFSQENMSRVFVKDIGPYSLWTTLVVQPDHPIDRPLRGFHYSIGQDIPGLRKAPACRSTTNLNVAGCLVDDEMRVTSIDWRIPALAVGYYQRNGKDYFVTREDMASFANSAQLAIRGGEGNGTVFSLEGERDALGSYGACYELGSHAFDIGRLRPFWVELTFTGQFEIKGAIPLIVTLNGVRTRGVQ